MRIGDVLNNVISTIVQAANGQDDADVLAGINLKSITYYSNLGMAIERLLSACGERTRVVGVVTPNWLNGRERVRCLSPSAPSPQRSCDLAACQRAP